MNRTIDERVVEMRFDNKQFESGAKETMSTLDKLKEKLNFGGAEKAFDKLEKAASDVKLEGISKAVEALEDRFSTMGIVGMRVVENLTDSLIGFVKKGINFATDAIVSGGVRRAMNIENAHFQLQSLLKDEELVQSIMDSANNSVTGTAYSYDVAAKAASMFAASGVKAGTEMDNALAAIANTTAAVNGNYERMSLLFTQISGQGRIMGNDLLQFANAGTNAAAILAKYWTEVKGIASDEGDIRDIISDKNQHVLFKDVVEAFNYSYEGAAKRANETFNGALSNVKAALARIGAGFISPLIEQNGPLVDLLNVLRVKINDVKSTLVFDEQLKNVNALSKQFTDKVKKIFVSLTKIIENFDVNRIMEPFYYGVEIAKELFIDFLTVFNPIKTEIKNAFGGTSIETLTAFLNKLHDIVQVTRLNVRERINLGNATKGLLDITKLLIDGFIKLLKVFVPINEPAGTFLDLILEIAGRMGELLSKFSEWIGKSETIANAYHLVSKAVEKVSKWLADLFENMRKFIEKVDRLESVHKAFNKLKDIFKEIKDLAKEGFGKIIDKANELGLSLKDVFPSSTEEMFDKLVEKVDKLATGFNNFEFSKIKEGFENMFEPIKKFFSEKFDKAGENAGTVGDFFVNLFKKLQKIFTYDNITEKLSEFREQMDKFITWISDRVKPFFEGISFEKLLGAAAVLGIVYSIIQISMALRDFGKASYTIAGSIKNITSLSSAAKKLLTEMAYKERAEAVLKTAEAIGVLAASIFLLALVPTEKLIPAALAVAVVAGIFLAGATSLLDAKKRFEEFEDGVSVFFKRLGSSLKKWTRAIEFKAFGKMLLELAASIAIIAGVIAGIAFMYKKGLGDELTQASFLVLEIVGFILLFAAATGVIGEAFGPGMIAFGSSVSKTILSVAAGLYIGVLAVEKLLSFDIGTNFEQKMDILKRLFIGLGVLSGILAILNKNIIGRFGQKIGGTTIMGEGNLLNGGSSIAGPVLGLAAGLYLAVLAMDKLFKLQLPEENEFNKKMDILKTIFKTMAVIAIVVTAFNKIAGGAGKKATASIVGMAILLLATVGAIWLLTTLDMDKVMKTLWAVIPILITIGIITGVMSKISGGGLAGTNSLKAMVLGIVAVVAGLIVLTFFDAEAIMKSALILCGVLIVFGQQFKQISKISNPTSWASVLSMAGVIVAIAAALWLLCSIGDMNKLYGATIALVISILAFAELLKQLGGIKSIKGANIKLMLELLIPIGAIALALYVLASRPWNQMLAAAGAMSLTILAFAKGFEMISNTRVNMDSFKCYLGYVILTGLIAGVAVGLLADKDWASLIAAGTALGEVILALSAGFWIISKAGSIDLKDVLNFVIMSLAVFPVAYALGDLCNMVGNPATLIPAATALSEIMLALSVVAAICCEIGAMGGIATAGAGIAALDALIADVVAILVVLGGLMKMEWFSDLVNGGMDFMVLLGEKIGEFAGAIIGSAVEKVTESLATAGTNLSNFATNAEPFFEAMGNLKPGVLSSVKALAEAMLILTGAELIEGIVGFLTGGILSDGKSTMDTFGEEIAKLGPHLKEFADSVEGIKPYQVKSAVQAAEMLAEIYKSMPKEDGWWQKIFGTDKKLSDFGKELSEFGPFLASYAESVKDVTAESVQGSADAAKILADLYKDLPNVDGGLQKLFGEKTKLDDFGNQLKTFAACLVTYCIRVRSITPESVEASAAATSILIDMANKLPSKVGFLTALFKGDNSLKTFGKELVSFGEDLIKYADLVKDLDTDSIDKAYEEMKKLLGFGKEVSCLNQSAITKFTYDLADLATEGVYGFVTAFTDSTETVTKAVAGMIEAAVMGINYVQTDFKGKGEEAVNQFVFGISTSYSNITVAGQTIVNKLIEGLVVSYTQFNNVGKTSINDHYLLAIRSLYQTANTTGTDISTNILNGIMSTYPQYTTQGRNVVTIFLTAIREKIPEAKATGTNLSSTFYNAVMTYVKMMGILGSTAAGDFINAINGRRDSAKSAGETVGKQTYDGINSYAVLFQSLGASAGDGFIVGIRSKLEAAAQAGREIAQAAYNAVKKELDINSPSKLTEELGNNFTKGLVDGINGKVDANLSLNMNNAPINSAIKDLNRSFNNAISSTSAKAATTASTMKNANGSIVNSSAASNKTVNQSNTINVYESNNPDLTAKKINNALANQYNKEVKQWA